MMEPARIRVRLSAQQKHLYDALIDLDPALARYYLGAIHVLSDNGNPDSLALSAHDIRELMSKLPEVMNVPVKALREKLKDKVLAVSGSWSHVMKTSACRRGRAWEGAIDHPLRKFLARLEGFFSWFEEHHPRRRKETGGVLVRMDVAARRVPPPLEELNVETWMEMYDYFVGVCHHARDTSAEEYLSWLDHLERFVLDRRRPRTFEDICVIEQLLQEANEGDQA